jgi:hypothetical protein
LFYQNLFLAKAYPEPTFIYFSNSRALDSVSKLRVAIATSYLLRPKGYEGQDEGHTSLFFSIKVIFNLLSFS